MEARKVVLGITVGEMALTLLLTWLLFQSNFALHASHSMQFEAGDVFVLVAVGVCLALFAFVLVYWQWRLSGRARVRLLLVMFLSLLWSFCGFCWHDVSLKAAEMAGGGGAALVRKQLFEQTAAVSVTLGALVLGLVGVIAVLRL